MSTLNLCPVDKLVNQEEQEIYDRLLHSVKTQSPEEIIEDFRYLFVRGGGYRDSQIKLKLETFVKSKRASKSFKYFINRCFYIVINHWQLESQLQSNIPELINLFKELSPPTRGLPTATIRLRGFMIEFTQTEYYQQLQRLARIISEKKNSPSVGSLINRYPYLYNHYLLSDDSSEEQKTTIKQIKNKIERTFELDLSKYITYKVRLAQIAKNPELAQKKGKIINTVNNPTLLTDKQLGSALKHYAGTVERGCTYRDLSYNFQIHTNSIKNFKTYKKELYDYLIPSVNPKYGKNNFNKRLCDKLEGILPQCDHKPLDEFLAIRTTSQLLNYLVVESRQNLNHYVFLDMISNIGPVNTVGLLLKLVLACHKVKPYLEKRFAILFNHYENFTKDNVLWLVHSLENLQIAFSVNYGKADLSLIKRIF